MQVKMGDVMRGVAIAAALYAMTPISEGDVQSSRQVSAAQKAAAGEMLRPAGSAKQSQRAGFRREPAYIVPQR